MPLRLCSVEFWSSYTEGGTFPIKKAVCIVSFISTPSYLYYCFRRYILLITISNFRKLDTKYFLVPVSSVTYYQLRFFLDFPKTNHFEVNDIQIFTRRIQYASFALPIISIHFIPECLSSDLYSYMTYLTSKLSSTKSIFCSQCLKLVPSSDRVSTLSRISLQRTHIGFKVTKE